MNIRIVAIDKMKPDEVSEFPYYIVHAEAQWLDSDGRDHLVEYQTMIDEDDLTADCRRAVTERAYEVIADEQVAEGLVGEEWYAPDYITAKGKVLSA